MADKTDARNSGIHCQFISTLSQFSCNIYYFIFIHIQAR